VLKPLEDDFRFLFDEFFVEVSKFSLSAFVGLTKVGTNLRITFADGTDDFLGFG